MTLRRALMTGGTGFIGAHLARLLLDARVEVTLLVRPSSDLARLRTIAGDARERAEIREVSLLSAAEVRSEALRARPEAVFHLAGDARPRAQEEEAASMTSLHVGAAASVAGAALAAQARLVAISTSDVYGRLPSPHAASGALDPQTPYARSKAAADELLLRLHRERGLDVVILRPYLVYGPAQAARQFLPALIAACLDDRPFPMTDGAQRRDFLFVEDAARAIARAGEAPEARGHVIDVCTGVPTRVLDVALAVAALIGPRLGGPVPGTVARGLAEPDEHFGDPTPAGELLGFRPLVPIAEGLALTVEAEKRARAAAERYR